MARGNVMMAKARKGKSKKRSSQDEWARTVEVMKADPRSSQYTHHKFIMNSGVLFSIQGQVGGTALGGTIFALSQIPNYANLTSLYDDYQIEKVELKFYLRLSQSVAEALPRLSVIPDFDDAVAPPSTGALFNHPRVKQHVFTEAHPEFTICLEPRVSIPAYQGAVTGYTVAPTKVWVDCANAGVQHYGVKYAVETFSNTSQYIDVYAKYFLSMRNPL
jgi:hypothetical protein